MHPKPKIVNHQSDPNGKIFFVLEVSDDQTGLCRTNKLRYSQFKSIHEQLEKLVAKLKLHIILPEFPGRKFFGSTNKSEESIF